MLALGWRGSARHWQRYETAYLLLAGLATPLVVSVHTVVSFDFAVAIVPGWHSTIFPPYFVAGAIFSGFAMVLTLAIPLRGVLRPGGLHHHATTCENMAKIMLATGLIVAYGYGMRGVHRLVQRQHATSSYMPLNRMFGPYALVYWTLIALQRRHRRRCSGSSASARNVAGAVRRSRWSSTSACGSSASSSSSPACTAISCRRPGACTTPTVWDWATFLGTIGLFFALLFLFIRFLPMISISEMRTLLPEARVQHDDHAGAAQEAH